MNRITKNTGFFKKNYNYLMGAFWFLTGIIMFIIGDGKFTPYFYTPFGIGVLIYAYCTRNKTEEFIAWDDSTLIVKDLSNEEKVFSLENIDAVYVSNNHLTIKSGEAGGIILELNGYKKGDILKLSNYINTLSSPVLN